jgi:putative spermidine/putrescine transport system permease protein
MEEKGLAKAWLLLVPAAALYAVTFVVPIGIVLWLSTATFDAGVVIPGFSLDNYRQALSDPTTVATLGRTLEIAAIVTLAAAALGYPIALQMRRSGPVTRTILIALVVAPLLTSVIVRNVAWILLLGRNGLINSALMASGLITSPLPLMYNDTGVVIATLHVYLTFLILPLYASLQAIDSRVEESAASLGASSLSVFWRITFPLSAPGLIAGASLVFILAMGLYLTPTIMGGSFVVTASMLITDLARNQYNWPAASALSIVLLATMGLTLLAAFATRKWMKLPS